MDGIPTYDAGEVHRAGFGMASFGGDDKLIKWFFDKPMLDGVQSKELNRPVFRNVPHVHIQQPGERDFIEQPATDEHVGRFPKQWEAYKQKREAKIEGTPLSILFPTNAAIVENLKHVSIHTVEQLAGLNDTAIQNIGLGGREFVTRAKAFLEAADKGKGFNELSARIDAMALDVKAKDDRIAALEAALTADGKEIPAARRKPGPKPKLAAAAA